MSEASEAGQYQAAAAETQTPRHVYEARRQRARAAVTALDRRAGRYADLRLVAFLALLAVLWAGLLAKVTSPWWILPVLGVFAGLVVLYDRAEAARLRSERLVEFYDLGLARLDHRWAGRGNAGSCYQQADHPFADDLDLFGTGSLFERICTARTHAGETTLARWLVEQADAMEIAARQQAVDELRSRLDLREELYQLGAGIGTQTVFEGLAEWGAAAAILRGIWLRAVALILSILALPTLFAWLFFGQSPWPFVAVGVCEAILALSVRRQVSRVLEQVERRTGELALLAGMLRRLERERFSCDSLLRLHAALDGAGHAASQRIEALRRWLTTLDARRNMMLGPISPLLLWGTQIAMAIEVWRAQTGPKIAGWLDAIGRFETLLDLAGYAYESPEDVFAEIVTEPPSRFEAVGLAHPLLPTDQAVRNDVSLGGDGEPRVLVVSGSNMSGKSTLLRAVGVASVLAQAGTVVRARALRLSLFSVGATLRIQDSLQAGRSRFYAEIVRLRQLIALASGPRPLLFLLDEVLAGTNSHDRHIGAAAIIERLAACGALGLVTTHDLALAEIADRHSWATNVHFGDELVDGVLRFDYAMRPGVVRHSNALALMRSIGIEV